jgi:hypothetical protein
MFGDLSMMMITMSCPTTRRSGISEYAERIVWKTHRFRKQTKQMKHNMIQMVNIAKMMIRMTHQSS